MVHAHLFLKLALLKLATYLFQVSQNMKDGKVAAKTCHASGVFQVLYSFFCIQERNSSTRGLFWGGRKTLGLTVDWTKTLGKHRRFFQHILNENIHKRPESVNSWKQLYNEYFFLFRDAWDVGRSFLRKPFGDEIHFHSRNFWPRAKQPSNPDSPTTRKDGRLKKRSLTLNWFRSGFDWNFLKHFKFELKNLLIWDIYFLFNHISREKNSKYILYNINGVGNQLFIQWNSKKSSTTKSVYIILTGDEIVTLVIWPPFFDR